MPRLLKQKKEAKVIADYFSAGLADAIRDSLKSLFSEAQLPDNPFYYLASALGAYVDQNTLWAETDVAIVSALDSNGGLEVADAASKLCKLAGCSCVLGLPHVLRTVSKEGAQIVHDVLTNSLPDSVFPSATPFSGRKSGYTVQLLSSVQGSTVVWHPQWLEFPELTVRCDVVIKGPRLDDALGLLADLLVSDLQELEAVPVYFVEGLRVTGKASGHTGKQLPKAAGPTSSSAAAAAGVGAGGARSLWRLSDMLARPEEFRRVLAREVLSGKQVAMGGVVMLEAPVDATHLQECRARFESCTKVYCFHFWETPDTTQPSLPAALARTHSSNSSSRREVSHYGSQPYAALLEGYFMEPAAAKAYLALFQASHAAAPYSKSVLQMNSDHLADLIEADVVGGFTLEGFRRLLLLVLLQDTKLQQEGPLQPSMLLTAEELLLSHPPKSQNDMLLSTWVNLVRMLNSGAAEMQAIVRELDALVLVVEQWPGRREACLAQATAAAATSAAGGGGESHVAATLAWLADHHNMEARVVEQLASIKPRVKAATGSGNFSGLSIILARLLTQLPDSVPATAEECKAVLTGAKAPMEDMRQMLAAAALSLADALLDRCRDVMWALQRFGIQLLDSVAARAALAGDGADVPPEWVLDVQAVTETQVRAGAVAERVGAEGVMLQYAVDTKLDLCLSAVYEAVTRPPLPLNPYPRLLHILRAHAAKLDLFQEDMVDVRKQLLNQLTLLDPPSFIYAAHPSPAATGGRRRHAGAALLKAADASGLEDEGSVTVFGAYMAVTLCDCRFMQALGASLGPLLSERQWQQGSYSADVLVALVGDAALSGALALGKAEEVQSSSSSGSNRPGTQGSQPTWGAYEHPRFYCVEVEEHHHVEGPDMSKATALFAKSVIEYVLELHQRSQHLVQQVVVGLESFQLPALLHNTGREALSTALTAAVSGLSASHPSTYMDSCVATVHLLAVVKEGLYVRLLRRLHFNYRRQSLPHNTANTAALAAHRQLGFSSSMLPSDASPTDATTTAQQLRAGGSSAHAAAAVPPGCGSRCSSWQRLQEQEQEGQEPHWGMGVYQRVFLTEASAQAWHSWNSTRGDPAQPFHYEHLVQQLQRQVPGLEAEGLLLDVQKLLLMAAVATQHADTMCSVSRCMQSAAQELRCLQDMAAALQFLLSEDLPQPHADKLDNERVRRLFLMYCSRLRRALTSPKYCYFSGFAATAPGLIAELREHVLSNSRLDARRAGVLQQLNMWTLACELSVAASIHGSLDSDVCSMLQRLLNA